MSRKKASSGLKNNEVAILGLLAERSRYGYELDKVITERGMRDWTDIAFSSIYAVLTELEKKVLVGSQKEISGNRVRKRYFITEMGLAEYKKAVADLLSQPRRKPYELDLGIASMPILSPKQTKNYLEIRQLTLQNDIAALEKLKQTKAKGQPYFVAALFDRPLISLKAELAFVAELIIKVDKTMAGNKGNKGRV